MLTRAASRHTKQLLSTRSLSSSSLLRRTSSSLILSSRCTTSSNNNNNNLPTLKQAKTARNLATSTPLLTSLTTLLLNPPSEPLQTLTHASALHQALNPIHYTTPTDLVNYKNRYGIEIKERVFEILNVSLEHIRLVFEESIPASLTEQDQIDEFHAWQRNEVEVYFDMCFCLLYPSLNGSDAVTSPLLNGRSSPELSLLLQLAKFLPPHHSTSTPLSNTNTITTPKYTQTAMIPIIFNDYLNDFTPKVCSDDGYFVGLRGLLVIQEESLNNTVSGKSSSNATIHDLPNSQTHPVYIGVKHIFNISSRLGSSSPPQHHNLDPDVPLFSSSSDSASGNGNHSGMSNDELSTKNTTFDFLMTGINSLVPSKTEQSHKSNAFLKFGVSQIALSLLPSEILDAHVVYGGGAEFMTGGDDDDMHLHSGFGRFDSSDGEGMGGCGIVEGLRSGGLYSDATGAVVEDSADDDEDDENSTKPKSHFGFFASLLKKSPPPKVKSPFDSNTFNLCLDRAYLRSNLTSSQQILLLSSCINHLNSAGCWKEGYALWNVISQYTVLSGVLKPMFYILGLRCLNSLAADADALSKSEDAWRIYKTYKQSHLPSNYIGPQVLQDLNVTLLILQNVQTARERVLEIMKSIVDDGKVINRRFGDSEMHSDFYSGGKNYDGFLSDIVAILFDVFDHDDDLYVLLEDLGIVSVDGGSSHSCLFSNDKTLAGYLTLLQTRPRPQFESTSEEAEEAARTVSSKILKTFESAILHHANSSKPSPYNPPSVNMSTFTQSTSKVIRSTSDYKTCLTLLEGLSNTEELEYEVFLDVAMKAWSARDYRTVLNLYRLCGSLGKTASASASDNNYDLAKLAIRSNTRIAQNGGQNNHRWALNGYNHLARKHFKDLERAKLSTGSDSKDKNEASLKLRVKKWDDKVNLGMVAKSVEEKMFWLEFLPNSAMCDVQLTHDVVASYFECGYESVAVHVFGEFAKRCNGGGKYDLDLIGASKILNHMLTNIGKEFRHKNKDEPKPHPIPTSDDKGQEYHARYLTRLEKSIALIRNVEDTVFKLRLDSDQKIIINLSKAYRSLRKLDYLTGLIQFLKSDPDYAVPAAVYVNGIKCAEEAGEVEVKEGLVGMMRMDGFSWKDVGANVNIGGEEKAGEGEVGVEEVGEVGREGGG